MVVGLADSLNPSTVGPALYFAIGEHAARRVLAFTAGVFVVNMVAGILLLVGPGQLILSALPHASNHTKALIELAAGIVLVIAAAVLFASRRRLVHAGLPTVGQKGALASGATIMVIELPTAVPYFGAIAAALAADVSLPLQILLITIFNVLFVAPLLAIAGILVAAPQLKRTLLEPAAAWLTKQWPVVFAALALLIGLGLIAFAVGRLT